MSKPIKVTKNTQVCECAQELIGLVEAILNHRGRCYIPNDVEVMELYSWDDRAYAAVAKAKSLLMSP